MRSWGKVTFKTLTGEVPSFANASCFALGNPRAVLNLPRWLTKLKDLVAPFHKGIQTHFEPPAKPPLSM